MSFAVSISLLPASGRARVGSSRGAQRTGRAGFSSSARACVQERIGNTSFYKAEQVKCVALRSRAREQRSRRRRAQQPAAAAACHGHDAKMPFPSSRVERARPARRYTMRLSSQIVLEPAIVMGGSGNDVKVKVLSNGAEVSVGAGALAKLGESFAPGDAIKRAMLNGQEEDATVRSCNRRHVWPVSCDGV